MRGHNGHKLEPSMAVPAQKSIERERERSSHFSTQGDRRSSASSKKEKGFPKELSFANSRDGLPRKDQEGYSCMTQKEDSTELDSRSQHPAAHHAQVISPEVSLAQRVNTVRLL